MDLLFHDTVLLLSNGETYEMIFVGVLGFEVLNLARAGCFFIEDHSGFVIYAAQR